MSDNVVFLAAFPYADDLLALPVKDLDAAANWYAKHFRLSEINREYKPTPKVIMQRNGIEIGFAINGGNPENEGAGILVSDINQARSDLEKSGISIGDIQTEERDGKNFQVFFVVAPDGLCYYFHQQIQA